jgi:hypothetical protein
VEEKSYGIRLSSPRDGEGHGDTFSAFSLALLVAHELAGKKPFRVSSMLDATVVDVYTGCPRPQTVLERAKSDFDYRAAEDEREYQELGRLGRCLGHNEEYRRMMHRVAPRRMTLFPNFPY